MQLIVCEYCGTEYKDNLPRCPLCGKVAAAAVRQESRTEDGKAAEGKGGAFLASGKKRKKDRIPKWMWMVSCVILAIAVLLCTVYILFAMGAFSGGEKQPLHEEDVTQTVLPEEPPAEEATEVPEEDMEVLCTDLVLSQPVVTLEEKSGFVFLTVIPEPVDCTETIFFSISDPSVAEIAATDDLSVMVTAVSPGTAIITVTCGDVTKTCTVLCQFDEELPENPEETELPEVPTETEEPEEPEVPAAEPTLNKTDFTLFHPGESFRLEVADAPEDAVISYVSSRPAVATVSETGLVTAVGSGTSNITVKVNDITLTCIARCNLADSAETGGDTTVPPAESTTQPDPDAVYTISHTDVTLKENDSVFTVTLMDEEGNAVTGENWSSSNSQVCTVDANGKVTASGTTGTADVTTTYHGKTYTCTVRCYYP